MELTSSDSEEELNQQALEQANLNDCGPEKPYEENKMTCFGSSLFSGSVKSLNSINRRLKF